MSTKIARWALMLSDFNYAIEHRHSTSMRLVYVLSRNSICLVIQDSLTPKIIQAEESVEHIKTIKEILKVKSYDYLVKNNVLYKCINSSDLLVLPDKMQMNVVKTAHKKGYYTVAQIENNLENEIYIPKVKQKI